MTTDPDVNGSLLIRQDQRVDCGPVTPAEGINDALQVPFTRLGSLGNLGWIDRLIRHRRTQRGLQVACAGFVRIRHEVQCTVEVADGLQVERQAVTGQAGRVIGQRAVEHRTVEDVCLFGSAVIPQTISLVHVDSDPFNRLRDRCRIVNSHFGSIHEPSVMSIPTGDPCLYVQGRQPDEATTGLLDCCMAVVSINRKRMAQA